MRLIKKFVFIGAVASLGVCGDVPKTLPPAMYESMKSGKKLEKVFVDPAYDRTKGFKLGAFDYKAEIKNSSILDALTKSMGMLVKADSPFTLKVAIVQVTTKTFTGFGNVMGKLTIEGQIVDAEGKVVAVFQGTERAGSYGAATDDYQAAADKLASAIAKDLL